MIRQPLLIFGAPASGKGTLAQNLSDLWGIPHISTGNLLRTSSDPMIQDYLKNGQFIESRIINKSLHEHIQPLVDAQQAYILDGYPRTHDQAANIASIDPRLLSAPSIYLYVDKDTARERMLGRAASEQRNDDVLDIFEKRFDKFEEQTLPIIDRLRGPSIKIDGRNSEKDVFYAVLKKLKPYM